MIYTVTLNPSLDYVMHIDRLRPGVTNRSASEELYPGGKGINVSTVLHRLGQATTALGFIAGFTGQAIAKTVAELGVPAHLIPLSEGISRINIKLRGDEETEINGSGPAVTAADFQKLLSLLDAITPEDFLVLSGSLPSGLSGNSYVRLMAAAKQRGARVVVDAAGDTLRQVLPQHPFLIKPNRLELCNLLNTVIDPTDTVQIARLARRLQQDGAQNVLVSLGGDGCLLLDENGLVHMMPAAGGTPVNTVGAGDSMIAGFVTGIALQRDYSYALRLGTACGGATAFPGAWPKQTPSARCFPPCRPNGYFIFKRKVVIHELYCCCG